MAPHIRLRSWFASVAPAAHSTALSVWLYGLPDDARDDSSPAAYQLVERIARDSFKTMLHGQPTTVQLVGKMDAERAKTAGVLEVYRKSFEAGINEHLDFLLLAARTDPPHMVDLRAAFPPPAPSDPLDAAVSSNDRLPLSLFDLGTGYRSPRNAPTSRKQLAEELRRAKVRRAKGKMREELGKKSEQGPWTDRDEGCADEDEEEEPEAGEEDQLMQDAELAEPVAHPDALEPAGIGETASTATGDPIAPAPEQPVPVATLSVPIAPRPPASARVSAARPPTSSSALVHAHRSSDKPSRMHKPPSAIAASVFTFFRNPSSRTSPPRSMGSANAIIAVEDAVARALADELAKDSLAQAATPPVNGAEARSAHPSLQEVTIKANEAAEPPSVVHDPAKEALGVDKAVASPLREAFLSVAAADEIDLDVTVNISPADGAAPPNGAASHDDEADSTGGVEVREDVVDIGVTAEIEQVALEKVEPAAIKAASEDALAQVNGHRVRATIEHAATLVTNSRLSPFPAHDLSSSRQSSPAEPFPASSGGISSLFHASSDDEEGVNTSADLTVQAISDFVQRDLASSVVDEDEYIAERLLPSLKPATRPAQALQTVAVEPAALSAPKEPEVDVPSGEGALQPVTLPPASPEKQRGPPSSSPLSSPLSWRKPDFAVNESSEARAEEAASLAAKASLAKAEDALAPMGVAPSPVRGEAFASEQDSSVDKFVEQEITTIEARSSPVPPAHVETPLSPVAPAHDEPGQAVDRAIFSPTQSPSPAQPAASRSPAPPVSLRRASAGSVTAEALPLPAINSPLGFAPVAVADAEPVEVSQPADEPVERVDVEPVEPIGAIEPVELGETTEFEKLVKREVPLEAVEPVEPVEPADVPHSAQDFAPHGSSPTAEGAVRETVEDVAETVAKELVATAVGTAVEPIAGALIGDAVSELASDVAGGIVGEVVSEVVDTAAAVVDSFLQGETADGADPALAGADVDKATSATLVPTRSSSTSPQRDAPAVDAEVDLAPEDSKAWMQDDPLAAPPKSEPGSALDLAKPLLQKAVATARATSTGPDSRERRSTSSTAMSFLAPSPASQPTARKPSAAHAALAALAALRNEPTPAPDFYGSPTQSPEASRSPQHDVFGPVLSGQAPGPNDGSASRSMGQHTRSSPSQSSSDASSSASAVEVVPLPVLPALVKTSPGKRSGLVFDRVEIPVRPTKRVAQPREQIDAPPRKQLAELPALSRSTSPAEEKRASRVSSMDAAAPPSKAIRDSSAGSGAEAPMRLPPAAESVSWLEAPAKTSRPSPQKYASMRALHEPGSESSESDDPLASRSRRTASSTRDRRSSVVRRFVPGDASEDDDEDDEVARTLLSPAAKGRAGTASYAAVVEEDAKDEEEPVQRSARRVSQPRVRKRVVTSSSPPVAAAVPPTKKARRTPDATSPVQPPRKPSLAGKIRTSISSNAPRPRTSFAPVTPAAPLRAERESASSSARPSRVRKPADGWWDINRGLQAVETTSAKKRAHDDEDDEGEPWEERPRTVLPKKKSKVPRAAQRVIAGTKEPTPELVKDDPAQVDEEPAPASDDDEQHAGLSPSPALEPSPVPTARGGPGKKRKKRKSIVMPRHKKRSRASAASASQASPPPVLQPTKTVASLARASNFKAARKAAAAKGKARVPDAHEEDEWEGHEVRIASEDRYAFSD